MSLGNTNDVNTLVHGKHICDWYLLLEVLPGEVDLVGHGSTIQLHLHKVRFLLPKVSQ